MTRPHGYPGGKSRKILNRIRGRERIYLERNGVRLVRTYVEHVKQLKDPQAFYDLQCAAMLCEELWILRECVYAGMSLNAASNRKPPISLLALHEMDMDRKLAMMEFAVDNGASLIRCHETDVAAFNVTAEVEAELGKLKAVAKQRRLDEKERARYEHLDLVHDLLLDAKVPALRVEGIAVFRMDDI